MEIVLTAPRSELAEAVLNTHAHGRLMGTDVRVLVNVALQPPNTLLHDGHAWRRYGAARLLRETRAALGQASDVDFVVHASYLFPSGARRDAEIGSELRAIADAALDAEDLVIRGPVPACVVRLGYLYGPGSHDLRAYRRAFRIGRPYWAGPSGVLQRHLHTHDAARALLAAARQHADGRTFCVADDVPASFATFMDHFARLVGNGLPLHIPGLMRPLTRGLIATEHVQMVDLASANAPDLPRPRAFSPRYRDFRTGLGQVIDEWDAGC